MLKAQKGRTMTPPNETITTDIPISCSLTVGERDTLRVSIEEILATVDDVEEFPAGYSFRFPNNSALHARILEWLRVERECCPFFVFTLAFGINGGPVWLRIEGPEGTREFVRDNIL